MKPTILSLLLGSLLFAGAAHATAAEHVRASHAWIRVLPGDLPAGGYVTLQNDSDQPAALSGASSTRYADVMLHHSSTAGGMSRMTMVDTMTVPAHGKAVLAPAGYHLMLMQPGAPVKPGDTVQLTLTFADGSTLATDFIARPANAMDAGDEHTGH
jgi:periplasmic copper chaperone A